MGLSLVVRVRACGVCTYARLAAWNGILSLWPHWRRRSEGRHHHIVDVAMVVCSDAAVLHFHTRNAAEAASSVGVPGAEVAGAASVTLRYAEHSVVPMTLAMMHTYLVGGRSLDH